MNDDLFGRPAPDPPTALTAGAADPATVPEPRVEREPGSATAPRPPIATEAGGEPGHSIGTELGAEPIPGLTPEEEDTDEPPSRGIDRQIRTVLEWVAVAVGALAVALLIKTFLLQAFYIPSGSMEDTLHRGDRVLVNKLSYDLHDVNRGDVVVFEKPPGEAGEIEDLIKRVIALPGETIVLQDGDLFIDGLLLDEPYLEDGMTSLAKRPIPHCDNAPLPDTCTVPEGRVFVMGDNREASRDSRFFGPIDSETIVGRAFLKVWPLSDIGFL